MNVVGKHFGIPQPPAGEDGAQSTLATRVGLTPLEALHSLESHFWVKIIPKGSAVELFPSRAQALGTEDRHTDRQTENPKQPCEP